MKINSRKKLYEFTKKQVRGLLTYDLKERAIYSKDEHLKLLISASLVNGFAEGVSESLNESPTGETLLSYIKTQTKEMLKQAFDDLLSKNVRKLQRQRKLSLPVPIAIDLHDVMYYGDHEETPMVIGTLHRDGSNYAFEYLTASVLTDGERLIVAVIGLASRGEIASSTEQIVRKLREELKVRIRYLVFDGGFFNTNVLRFLEESRLKYIVRIGPTYNTKKMRLWQGRRFTYTTSGHRRRKSEQASFEVVVAYDKTKDYKYLFATSLPHRAETILKLFKNRWGIETSYRMSNQFLTKTTSRNYVVRLFYYLFACLVYNAWVTYNNNANQQELYPNDCPSIEVIQMKLLLIGLIMNESFDMKGKHT